MLRHASRMKPGTSACHIALWTADMTLLARRSLSLASSLASDPSVSKMIFLFSAGTGLSLGLGPSFVSLSFLSAFFPRTVVHVSLGGVVGVVLAAAA